MLPIKTEEIINYAISKSSTPSQIADQLENVTRDEVPMSQMLCGKMEGSVLGLITRMVNAKRILEFGTFTGYSSLVFAENLPESGEVHTIDINPETVEFGKKVIKDSEHFQKIHSHIGLGLEVIEEITGDFDLVFIDADKENYLSYFKAGLNRLNPGGAIVVDNVLWGGNVIDQKDQSASTVAIREINDFIAQDSNLYGTLLPIRDGIFVVLKT